MNTCTGSLHTRTQLLLAAKLMRTECGVNGLGRLHTRSITDANGRHSVSPSRRNIAYRRCNASGNGYFR